MDLPRCSQCRQKKEVTACEKCHSAQYCSRACWQGSRPVHTEWCNKFFEQACTSIHAAVSFSIPASLHGRSGGAAALCTGGQEGHQIPIFDERTIGELQAGLVLDALPMAPSSRDVEYHCTDLNLVVYFCGREKLCEYQVDWTTPSSTQIRQVPLRLGKSDMAAVQSELGQLAEVEDAISERPGKLSWVFVRCVSRDCIDENDFQTSSGGSDPGSVRAAAAKRGWFIFFGSSPRNKKNKGDRHEVRYLAESGGELHLRKERFRHYDEVSLIQYLRIAKHLGDSARLQPEELASRDPHVFWNLIRNPQLAASLGGSWAQVASWKNTSKQLELEVYKVMCATVKRDWGSLDSYLYSSKLPAGWHPQTFAIFVSKVWAAGAECGICMYDGDQDTWADLSQFVTLAVRVNVGHVGLIGRKRHCVACKQIAPDVKHAFQRCSACKTVSYCSQSCQQSHWKQHKPQCLAAQGRAKGDYCACVVLPCGKDIRPYPVWLPCNSEDGLARLAELIGGHDGLLVSKPARGFNMDGKSDDGQCLHGLWLVQADWFSTALAGLKGQQAGSLDQGILT
ncbi:unnamed protein product [Polarella glacialis]|nr:unnamed protein product [Polarella glacialis]